MLRWWKFGFGFGFGLTCNKREPCLLFFFDFGDERLKLQRSNQIEAQVAEMLYGLSKSGIQKKYV